MTNFNNKVSIYTPLVNLIINYANQIFIEGIFK